jgi:M6 family metalloprotease-like protein
MSKSSLFRALALACACLAARTDAAPFDKMIVFTQPDGTAVKLHGRGDEFRADFETFDGYTVVYDQAARAYVYAARSADGSKLVSSGLFVGRDDPRANGLAQHVRADPKAAKAEALKRHKRWDDVTRNSARWRERKAALRSLSSAAVASPAALAPPNFTVTGTKVGLCLLIDFDDDPATIPQASIVDFCNGDAYTGYGNNGSVKKFFKDNSNNLLTYTNIVTAYVRIPNTLHPKSYYNDTSQDCGNQANLLIADAITIMKALPNYASQIAPAFSNLTRDASGYVTACNVFYAGGNGGVWSYGLWPHSWSLYNVGQQTLVPGVILYDYQITDIGDTLELGTFCHENGHMLCGYPDIYDYGYDSVGGAGMFCLMDYGGSGANPVQICAYLKRASGWATTVELTSTSNLTASVMSSGSGFNRFYRFAKPGVATEYYLVENRHKAGRDAGIPASGVAVWHIDELGDKDNQSLAYNATHANYEVTLMQADHLWHFQNNVNSGDTNDLYYSGNSSSGYANQFNDGSSPSARWWDGSLSGVSFHTFSANTTNMTFAVSPAPLAIGTTSPLPSGTIGVPYGKPLEALGGTAPYTWAIISNALPAGLSLVGNVITGTPSATGTTVFKARVTDAAATNVSATFSLTIAPPRSIPFTEAFESGGAIPDGWTQTYVSGAMPWAFQSGSSEGVPASAHGGSYNAFFFEPGYTGSKTMLISPMLDFGVAPEPSQLSFWHCMANWGGDQDELRVYCRTSYTSEWTQVAAFTSDTPAWTFRSVSLPGPNRTYYVAFEGYARYGYGVCVDDVTVSSGGTPPTISTPSPLPAGWAGLAYSAAFSAYGGMTPYSWSVASNAPPAGLALSGDGTLSGTPAAAASSSFRVCVTGSDGKASTNLFTLAISARRPLPFTETFEAAGAMPSGWSQEHLTNTTSWTFQSGGYYGHPAAAHGGAYNAFLYINSTSPRVTRLLSPVLDFGASTKSPQLTFWHCMQLWSPDQDELRVYCKPTPASDWQQLAAYTADVASWTQRTLSLPGPSRAYRIAFVGCAKYGYGICLDDVSVTGATSAYATWQTNRFTDVEMIAGAITGDSDDPDGDGVPNLLEYALGLDPRAADEAGLPGGGIWNRFLTLNYRQNKQATDVAYAIESCTNLANAAWTTNNVSEVSRVNSNLWWFVTAKHNTPVTNAPSRFMRLKVSVQ